MCIVICISLCIYTYMHACNGLLLSFKEGNLVICDNMDETGGHYAKRNFFKNKKRESQPHGNSRKVIASG